MKSVFSSEIVFRFEISRHLFTACVLATMESHVFNFPRWGSYLSGCSHKLLWQIFRLRNLPACELKEPHFKHFSLERYSQMYELREKGKVLIRIVFTVQNEDVILLTSFIKRQPRDTKKALDQSLYILSDIQQHPDRTSNFDFQREATA